MRFLAARILSGCLAAVFLSIPAPSVDVTAVGVSVMLLRIHDVFTVAALFGVCLLVGSFLLRRRLGDRMGGLLAIAVFLVAGSGVLGALLMVAGLLGLFRPIAVLGVVVGVATAAGSLANLSSVRHHLTAAWREVLAVAEARSLRLLPLVSGALLAYTLLMALGPTTSWDGPMYHVSLPRQVLAEGRIFLPPDNLHLAFVGSPHMLNAVVLAAGAESGPSLIQWAWTAVLLGLVVTTLVRWVSPEAGAWGSLLFWAYPILPLLGASDLVDISMTTALLTLLLVVADRLESNSRSDGIVLGFLGGAAASTKYQALAYLAAIGAVVLLWILFERVRVGAAELLTTAVIALVLIGPQLVRNAVHLGAPFYPFFADPVYPQWLTEVMEGRSFDLSDSYGILSSAREPFSLDRWIFSPATLTPEDLGSWYGFPPLFLAGSLAILTSQKRRLLILLLAVGGGALFILQVSSTINLRYLLPVAPVAVVLLAVAVTTLVKRIPQRAHVVVIAGAALAAGLAIQSWMAHATMPSGRAMAGAGVTSTEEFLDRPSNSSERRAYLLGEELRHLGVSETRPGLLFYEARGDLIDAHVSQDNVFTNWVMLDEALGSECLPSGKIGFLVRSVPTLSYLQSRGVSDHTLREDSFRSFAERCLTLVDIVEGYEVYAVR